MPFSPITSSDKKNNPQNIKYIPPVIFFVFLVLDEKFLFRSDTSLIQIFDSKKEKKLIEYIYELKFLIKGFRS